jgi:hypothetical protein
MRIKSPFVRLRFRTATLLWLVVVVAAFFIGRQWEEVDRRVSLLWISIWPNSSPRLTHTPDGSVLFAINSMTQRILRSNDACDVEAVNASTIRFVPVRDGVTEVDIWTIDGKRARLQLKNRNGFFYSVHEFSVPAT